MPTPEEANLHSDNTPNKKKSSLLWLGLAAAILIGILVLFLFLKPSPEEQYSAEDLYAANFEAYPNLLFPIETNSIASAQSSEQKALQLYQEKDYLSAIDSIDSILKNNSNIDLVFYQSIAQLASDKNTDALINLSNIVESKQGSFVPQARWYLALAYLKIGASEEAKVILQELAKEEKGFKSNRSAAILEILREQEAQ